MLDDLQIIKDTFFGEAGDIIEDLDGLLLELENAPSDLELLNAIFRNAHTLKGSCGILGFKELEHFTHAMEDMLDNLRNESLKLSSEIVDILFESLDLIKEMIGLYKAGEQVEPAFYVELEKKVRSFLPSEETSPSEIKSSESTVNEVSFSSPFLEQLSPTSREKASALIKEGKNLYYIDILLDEDCFTKGLDPLVLVQNAASKGDIIESKADTGKIPHIQDLDPFVLYIGDIEILLAGSIGLDEIEDIFEFAREGGSVTVHQLTPKEAEVLFGSEFESFWPEEGDGLQKEGKNNEPAARVGEILVEEGDVTEDQLSIALEKQARPIGTILVDDGVVSEDKVEKALQKQKMLGVKPRTAIKVDTEKLDSLVNLVGELVISQTMVSHNRNLSDFADNDLLKTVALLGKITRDIQERVMSMRMIPLKGTFQKMMRVARDVSKKEDKEVELRISGEETELDKTVIDEIGDPLLHILRNSIGHGIEGKKEREKAGKPEKGIIELKAFHQGGSIVIEISDDGKGLDKETIGKKAVERGLVDKVSNLSDDQIYNFIMEPGFSTAAKITDVSGRGVGMDVVKKNIEKLRGKVEISTVPGQGTTFALRLPLTLAIIDGMVVKVDSNRYIIPTISIIELLQPTKEQVSTVEDKGEMIMIRNELFPLIRLNEFFNINSERKKPWDALIILVEGGGWKGCLLVDELLGQQQVVIKSLGDAFKGVRGVAGSAILGDGGVGLILDATGILGTLRDQ